jgi:vancomycin resistance protein YoaR
MKTKKYLFVFGLFFFNAQIAIAADTQTAAAFNDAAQTKNLTISVGQYSETLSGDTLNKWLVQKTSLGMDSNYKTEFENTAYCPVSKIFCAFTLPVKNQNHLQLTSQTNLDQAAIKAYLEDLARKVNSDPVDAKFSITDGKVTTFTEEKVGITLDAEKSLQTLISALTSKELPAQIALNYDSKKPAINYGEVNNFGISALIGEGTSNFKGSPSNRIHNIKVATERYDGLLIKPGEEFSFVKALGEVDGDHGYLPELVIKNNATEPEFGGGICQVSSTAFRAAIYSGLKITARRNHAYPVSYYNPQGMDATVYVPNPDLRFVNNTPGYILIQTKIVGTVLTFDFYGTDDGRKTTVDGPTITERQPDGALKATFTQHVFDKDGKEIIKDIFNSAYNSPYRYPHPGGPTLSAKPANWSSDEWKNYQKMLKDMAKGA